MRRDVGILKEMLNVAEQHGLNFNCYKKCYFLRTRVEFLGHIIKNGTVRPSENKVKAVVKFKQPANVKQVQSFLELTGYFRKYIPNYSLIMRPLSDLLKSDVKFHFDGRDKSAFKQLKLLLSNKPILKLYRVKPEMELYMDVSMYDFGAILFQRDNVDNTLHLMYYASGKTTQSEMKYKVWL